MDTKCTKWKKGAEAVQDWKEDHEGLFAHAKQNLPLSCYGLDLGYSLEKIHDDTGFMPNYCYKVLSREEIILYMKDPVQFAKNVLVAHGYSTEDLTSLKKAEFINVNGHKVPKPETVALERGTKYFIPDTRHVVRRVDRETLPWQWEGDELDMKWLKSGCVHLSEENAKIHLEAMLSHMGTYVEDDA